MFDSLRLLPFACLALLPGACAGEADETLVDPEVDYGDSPAYEVTGDPELEVGFYVEQLYQPLGSDDEMPVVYGLQGGTWSMPALRIRGIDVEVELTASLVTDEGEVLGEVQSDARFVLATDGWLEIQALPIPVERQAPFEEDPVDELYGEPATLKVRVEDEAGRSARVTLPVLLGEG